MTNDRYEDLISLRQGDLRQGMMVVVKDEYEDIYDGLSIDHLDMVLLKWRKDLRDYHGEDRWGSIETTTEVWDVLYSDGSQGQFSFLWDGDGEPYVNEWGEGSIYFTYPGGGA